ncbi:low temperature requirement protein A [Aphanizomenon flos-aquae NRERC-008]|jgi:low temperature requirement protein LtrA|uniref:Low temperature requirement protein A n=1 Tax=Aphanizomenon flos-aquae FACHB-1249 TaxID=2692889 RepID=A0ABR8IUB8_APHFL|nr:MULTISPECIES: low temperature requirement protein A [Aphanizomenon]MCE2905768.1 low temperature requirement protein A [Anabaena sp. CoA2_C59]MDJ0505175.1 low temperature requirement protein A [Nostocales cyanobacterium LE14-WE12]MBD2391632.1 low temperature requirement protein A [Aphanizomenon flos-aquae FACHB-1171]MBD2559021.1 low temperature requirement protein A [Aphanizomenon flos-aquae FACHB-1290]MBD2630476.1 low temperature requirement protein A [Aphanizomenon sp. FACHB-1399]
MKKGLWQAPRLRIDEQHEERRATWLELFYDLVFVAAIAELSHNLSKDISLGGLVGFVAMFIPIWWCWVGATFYATLFDTDDLSDRLLTLLQMSIIIALTVNFHHGLNTSSHRFAISYIAARCILILQYLIAGHHVPQARPLTSWYVKGCSIGVVFWLGSLFVPIPWRFGCWTLGLIVEFITPLGTGHLAVKIPPNMSHVPERIGLFTIIVLGESMAAVVRGVAEKQWDTFSVLTAVLGVSIAFSFWWLYFDSVDASPVEAMKLGRIKVFLTWLYSHLLLAIGLVAVGVGVEHIITQSGVNVLPANERWLFCGAVALSLMVLAVTNFTNCVLDKMKKRRILSTYRLGAGSFILFLAIAGNNLSPVVLMALVSSACMVTVVLDLLTKSQFFVSD